MRLNWNKLKTFLINWAVKLIGLCLLIVLLRKVDVAAFLGTLQQFDLLAIILLEIISALVIITKAWRFKMLAGRYAIPIGFKQSIVVYGSSMFFSTITPGRLGDFIKVFYLKNLFDSSLPKGFYLSIVDRIFDLITIALFATCGMALFLPVSTIAAGLLFFFTLVLLLLFLGKKYLFRLVAYLKNWIKRRFKINVDYLDLASLWSRRLILPGFFSLIPNGLIFLQMLLIAYTAQVDIKPLALIGTLALGNLISMLPITISGLGTRDATFVFLLGKTGVPATQALSLSLTFFLFNNLGILLLGLILFLLFKPKSQA